jgi:PIN domain nuclease of toxin-antitoxin system
VTYLLDSHTFVWAVQAPEKLSRKARRICEQSRAPLVVSVASIWELAGKCALRQLSIPDFNVVLPEWMRLLNVRVLPLQAAHAYAVYGLPMLHRDPFDRMLIAQAIAEDLTLVTSDHQIHQYAVKWAW